MHELTPNLVCSGCTGEIQRPGRARMLAVLVNNVLAIPSSHKNTLAAKTDSLVLSNGGPCTVNRETNCVCSSNFNTDECDNTATTGTGGTDNHEDCDIEWSETVGLAVPYFETETNYDQLTVDICGPPLLQQSVGRFGVRRRRRRPRWIESVQHALAH